MRALNLEDILFIDIESKNVKNEDSIICICVGKLSNDNKSFLNLRCFYNEKEADILQEFNSFLSFISPKLKLYHFDNHNFEFELLTKRMKANGIIFKYHNNLDFEYAKSYSIENPVRMHTSTQEIEEIINNSFSGIVNTVQLLLSVKKLNILATENIYYV